MVARWLDRCQVAIERLRSMVNEAEEVIESQANPKFVLATIVAACFWHSLSVIEQ
jgi:hypothetical protein